LTTDPQSYRRQHRVTKITERVVVRTVVGVRRRINWRLRELSIEAGRKVSLIECLEAVGYHGGKSSVWHIIKKADRKGRMTRKSFDVLTAALRMDEVDGWDRPWPWLPPVKERRNLVDVIQDELTAEGPGEE